MATRSSFLLLSSHCSTESSAATEDIQRTKGDTIKSLDERILELVDEAKKHACLNYGWRLNLYDSEDKESGYPFVHLKIYWNEKENQKVIDYVNKLFFDDVDIKYSDLAIFTNNYNAGDCHNAVCSLMENSQVTEWLLKESIGKVFSDFDEDFEILAKSGLKLEHKGKYSCIGRIKEKSDEKIRIKIENDGYFIPNKIREISSKRFYEWYAGQERFEILDDDSEDFWYCRDSVIETIKKYRANPKLFLEDYPLLGQILGA